MKTKISRLLPLLPALAMLNAGAAQAADMALSGDLGAGALHAPAGIRGERVTTDPVPFANLSYGPFFARVDTFGVELLPVGYGAVELVGQVRADGYEARGLQRRQDAVPVGVGTLQVTPIGAFGVQVLHDAGHSGGTLAQLRYLAEFELGPVTILPEIGAEYQSRAYTRYYAGTTALDAVTLGRSYRPAAAWNGYFGLLVDVPLHDRWHAHAIVRHTVLDATLANSPLAAHGEVDSALLALAYRF